MTCNLLNKSRLEKEQHPFDDDQNDDVRLTRCVSRFDFSDTRKSKVVLRALHAIEALEKLRAAGHFA